MKRTVSMAVGLMAAMASAGMAQPGPPARLAPAPGIRADVEFLAGTWSDHEDCSQAIVLARDGRFINPDGTQGTWRLEGDLLTMSAARQIAIRIVPRNRDELIVIQANGTLGYSRRCAPAAGPTK